MGPVAVIGVGLIGGSVGLALRERAGVDEVRGHDPDAGTLRQAAARGAVTAAAASVAEAVAGAGVVVLAPPVSRLAEVARTALAAAGPDCVVTDVGSVKSSVLQALTPDERQRFIGGHPVAGGESSGVEFASGDLFDGATWFLTPPPEAAPALFERLHSLVAALGARPVAIDAVAHDRLMALVSHLPHVIASTLVNQAAETAPSGRDALRSSGPSFADLTRVAGSNPPLWADILLANREPVLDALQGHLTHVGELAGALRDGDREAVESVIERAARARRRLRGAAAAAGSTRWRVVVAVPNAPGVFSEIATALGHAHLNIEDLQLRPAGEEGGELDLTFADERAARAAASVVAALGHRSRAERAGPGGVIADG